MSRVYLISLITGEKVLSIICPTPEEAEPEES